MPNIFSGWNRKWNPWSFHFRQAIIDYLFILLFNMQQLPSAPSSGHLNPGDPVSFPINATGELPQWVLLCMGTFLSVQSQVQWDGWWTHTRALLPLMRVYVWTSVHFKGHFILCPSAAFSFNTLDLCSDYFMICFVDPQFSTSVKTRDRFLLLISSAD